MEGLCTTNEYGGKLDRERERRIRAIGKIKNVVQWNKSNAGRERERNYLIRALPQWLHERSWV